ncbi:nucleobase-ascorbate transporter 2, partial [Tanacetum coccineum]
WAMRGIWHTNANSFLSYSLSCPYWSGLIAVIWAYAHLLIASGAYKHHPEQTQMHCRTDKSAAPWIKIPYPLQWGAPTFDAGHSFGMMAAVLVSLVESTGAYKAAARLASATPPPAHVLSRGIGWQFEYLKRQLAIVIRRHRNTEAGEGSLLSFNDFIGSGLEPLEACKALAVTYSLYYVFVS